MNLKITKHACDQVKFRTKNKKNKRANFFLIGIFKKLYNNKYYKGRKIIKKDSRKGTKILTDGHHKIVYILENGLYTIITYAVVDEYCNKIEGIFNNIFKK